MRFRAAQSKRCRVFWFAELTLTAECWQSAVETETRCRRDRPLGHRCGILVATQTSIRLPRGAAGAAEGQAPVAVGVDCTAAPLRSAYCLTVRPRALGAAPVATEPCRADQFSGLCCACGWSGGTAFLDLPAAGLCWTLLGGMTLVEAEEPRAESRQFEPTH